MTRADVVGLLRHDARDVDKVNGVEVKHSNTMIDPALTALNSSLVNDGSGNMIPMTKVEQAVAFLDKRISETQNTRTLRDGKVVKVALRKDASAVVEFIVMLDPKFTRDPSITDEKYEAMTVEERAALPPDAASMSPERVAEVKCLLGVMVAEVMEQMGADNVVTISEHCDESHPHVQMMAVPVTHDGMLSMKQKLGGAVPGVKPTKAMARARYAEMHDSMRDRLRAAGYDATMERVDAGKRHLPLEQFKKFQDEKRTLKQKQDQVVKVAKVVRQSEKINEERATEINAAAADWEAYASELDAREDSVAAAEADLPKRRKKAQADGMEKARKHAREELTSERTKAAQAAEDAHREAERHQAATKRLDDLQRDVEADLAAAGQMPEPPTYDEMRDDILKAQQDIAIRFIKSAHRKFKDGTTLEDQFERFQNLEFEKMKQKKKQPLHGYRGPSFEDWRTRTVAAEEKLNSTRRQADPQDDAAPHPPEDQDDDAPRPS